MGKALIISDLGEGRYAVQVLHDWAAADSKLTVLSRSLAIVEEKIAAEAEKEDPGTIDLLTLRKVGIEKQIAAITDLMDGADYETTVWCADYAEGLSGEVGTIEPGTEYKNGINIYPGYSGGAAHDLTRDGQAVPFASLPVADALRNFALMPAIQKWRPTYRKGTISNIDIEANTCTVTLDAASSLIQDLDINQAAVLHNVTVQYMSCHASVFEEGDRVIVAFTGHDWSSPKVIGFESEPAPCGWVEPWDGPEVTSRWPWQHNYSAVGGSGDPGDLATAVVVDGSLRIIIDALPPGENWIQHTHQWYYYPSPGPIHPKAGQVVFNVSAMIDCYSQGILCHIYELFLIGEKEGQEIEFHIRAVCNYTWDLGHIGCNGWNYPESDWMFGWADLRYGWHKNILNGRAAWIPLPVTDVDIKAVIVRMDIFWSGGVDPPGDFPGATMSIHHIAIS